MHSRTIEVLDQRGVADRFLAEGQVVQVATLAATVLDMSDFPTRHPGGSPLPGGSSLSAPRPQASPIVAVVTRRPWLLGLVLALVTAGIAAALLSSEPSGTGAENVGESGPEPIARTEPQTAEPERAERRCKATKSNPGGTNNYIPDAPERDSLGRGFVIGGLVRSADGCRPLEGVRIQVWLATETGGEQDNRASVRTGSDGRYRIETAPTVAQFGEPNIHVGYDDENYDEVFIRRVVDLDDERAVVNLTLVPGG